MGELIEYNNVREMNRNELLSFLYDYIQAGTYVDEHKYIVNTKISKYEIEKSRDLEKLDDEFNAFYDEHLTFHERQTKKRLSEPKSYHNKWTSFIKIRKRHIVSLWLVLTLILIMFDPQNSTEIAGFMLFLGVYIVITLGFFVFMMVLLSLIFSPILSFGKGIIQNIVKFGNQQYENYAIRSARKKDIISAKRKGITKDNIRDVFQYDEKKQAINNKYETLNSKIRSWNSGKKYENNKIRNKLGVQLPQEYKKMDYIVYMYNQIDIGANDTWKEAINDLKWQLRHDELKQEFRKMTNNINKTNNTLVNMNRQINSEINGLSRMITREQARLDSRIDGMFHHIENYGYY